MKIILYTTKKKMDQQELRNYFKNYRSKYEDNYTSFTYGRFLYCMLTEGRVDENSDMYGYLEENVKNLIDKDRGSRVTPKLIAEFLDLSELQEVAETFIFNIYE